MLRQQIRRLTGLRHQILYPGDSKFRLVVDFGPLVEALGLEGNYCLIHWQARPRGERRWGAFCCEDGQQRYESFLGYRAEVASEGVQLAELELRTVPSAVVVYRDARVRVEGDFAVIVAG